MNPVVGAVAVFGATVAVEAVPVLAFAVVPVGGRLFLETVLLFVAVFVFVAAFFCASIAVTNESRQTTTRRGRRLTALLFTVQTPFKIKGHALQGKKTRGVSPGGRTQNVAGKREAYCSTISRLTDGRYD
jgi:hypothetical protein